MKIFTLLTLVTLSLAIGLAAACSTATNTGTTNQTKNAANTANAPATNSAVAPKKDEDAPASVKTAFPDASFTKQHKDLSKDQIALIEKETNAKVPDTDHHSYLAFSTAGGARKQIGAATVVKADGKEFIIIYDNKEGRPFVKEVRGEGVPAPFLAQFAGKNHDDKFKLGADIKANGVDEKLAKAIAEAVRVDAMTMQTLYGAADKH